LWAITGESAELGSVFDSHEIAIIPKPVVGAIHELPPQQAAGEDSSKLYLNPLSTLLYETLRVGTCALRAYAERCQGQG